MPKQQPLLPIGAVEAETGIPKDTLRVWQRRYGFPSPSRHAAGQRLYRPEQVEKLKIVKQLVDRGHRPGNVMHLDIDSLGRLAASAARRPRTSGVGHSDVGALLTLVRERRILDFRLELERALLQLGLQTFILGKVRPLLQAIGDSWECGDFKVFEEHFATEQINNVLRRAGAGLSTPRDGSVVLLTTLPGEQHTIGLLMLEALLGLHGATCLSLGGATPLDDIVECARVQEAVVVALSITEALPAVRAEKDLALLRTKLPKHVALWVGGAGTAHLRKCPKDVTVMATLEEAILAFSATETPPQARLKSATRSR